MRIDPKFFNRTILIASIFSIILIAIFTLRSSKKNKDSFEKKWMGSTEWNRDYIKLIGSNDSTRIQNVQRPILIYFWSGWSSISIQGLNELMEVTEGKEITILAAIVKDADEASLQIKSESNTKPLFVKGTHLYLKNKVPAVPSLVFIDSTGTISDIKIGYETKSKLKERLDSY